MAESLPNLTALVFGEEEYVFKCQPGFVYPSSSPHRPNGKQILRCNGAKKTYEDTVNGVTDGKIEACEKPPGCKKPSTVREYRLISHLLEYSGRPHSDCCWP